MAKKYIQINTCDNLQLNLKAHKWLHFVSPHSVKLDPIQIFISTAGHPNYTCALVMSLALSCHEIFYKIFPGTRHECTNDKSFSPLGT